MLNAAQCFLERNATGGATPPLLHTPSRPSIQRQDVMLNSAQVFQKQTDHPPLSSAEVTNTWSYTSAPLHIT